MVMPASCDDALVARGPLSLSLSTFLFSVYCAAAPNLWSVRNPSRRKKGLPAVLSDHTAFSAPRTKTEKEVNKQQPVAILAQGHWCRARKKNRYLLPISLFAFHSRAPWSFACALLCLPLLFFPLLCFALGLRWG